MKANEQAPELNDRAQHILKVLVEDYIQDGQPVGSRRLAKSSGLALSAATIRNVMADLEEMGYIRAPHTSAGRIPTEQGYRLFVDSLISVDSLDEGYLENLRLELSPSKPNSALVESASHLLSQLTSQAGIVVTPRSESCRMEQVEFVPLSGNRVLVVLVLSDKDVENRIIHT